MAKKKGSLKSAIASYNREREAKAHQKAVQEAQQRKLDSYGRPNKHQKLSKSPSPKTSASGPSSSSSANDQHDQPSGSNHVSTRTHNRTVEPFSSEDTILIVGEANFSFTLALLNPPRSHAPHQILSTAYDSEDECYQKYPDAKENVRKIRKIAGRDDVVIFGVDAGQLDKVRQVTGRSKAQKLKAADDPSEALAAQRRWSKVWFGFPHVGAGHKDETRNVLANQLLLLRFFISVAPYLTRGKSTSRTKRSHRHRDDSDDDDDAATAPLEADSLSEQFEFGPRSLNPPSKPGSVLITLRNASPYTLWNLPSLAKRLPEMLTVVSSAAPPLPKGCKKPTLKDLEANGLSIGPAVSQASPGQLKKDGQNARQGGIGSGSGSSSGQRYQLWRSFEFDPKQWHGYQHRRTIGWIEGLSEGDNADLLRQRQHQQKDGQVRASRAGRGECRTWEFGLE